MRFCEHDSQLTEFKINNSLLASSKQWVLFYLEGIYMQLLLVGCKFDKLRAMKIAVNYRLPDGRRCKCWSMMLFFFSILSFSDNQKIILADSYIMFFVLTLFRQCGPQSVWAVEAGRFCSEDAKEFPCAHRQKILFGIKVIFNHIADRLKGNDCSQWI